MKKKLLAGFITVSIVAGVLTACGANNQKTNVESKETAKAEVVATTETEKESEEPKVESKGIITIAASEIPHSQILEQAKSILAEKGLEATVNDI